MVVATLHLGHSVTVAGAGRVASMVPFLPYQPVLLLALPDMLFCHPWPQRSFDDRRIALAEAGRGPVIDAMQEFAKDWAAEERAFEIGMNRARCRCLDGLLETVQPDGTTFNQQAMDARGCATLGKARHCSNPSGCGSG